MQARPLSEAEARSLSGAEARSLSGAEGNALRLLALVSPNQQHPWGTTDPLIHAS